MPVKKRVKKSVKGRVKKSVRRIAVPNEVMVQDNEVMVQDNGKVKVEKQSRFNIFKKFLSKHKGKIFLAITLLITLGVGKKYQGEIGKIINDVQGQTGLPKRIIEFLSKLVQKNPDKNANEIADQVVPKPEEAKTTSSIAAIVAAKAAAAKAAAENWREEYNSDLKKDKFKAQYLNTGRNLYGGDRRGLGRFGKRRRKVRKVSITTLKNDLKKLKRM